MSMQRNRRIIAIDFDGVIWDCKNKTLITGAAEGIKALHELEYILILWTCRAGNRLANAKNILKRHDLLDYFAEFNKNIEPVKFKTSNKLIADYYIDDRIIGGFPGWPNIILMIKKQPYCGLKCGNSKKN